MLITYRYYIDGYNYLNTQAYQNSYWSLNTLSKKYFVTIAPGGSDWYIFTPEIKDRFESLITQASRSVVGLP